MNTPAKNCGDTGLALESSQARALVRLATLAVGCIVYGMVALVLLHGLQPATDPVKQVMSNYARGPYGFLLTLAMLCVPVVMVSLAIGFHRTLVRPIRSRLRLIPLGIAGLGWLLQAFFPLGPTAARGVITTSDRIHGDAGFVAVLWVLVVMAFYSHRFRSDPRWRAFARRSLALAVAAWLTFIASFVTLALGWSVAGAMQRILFSLMLLWSLLATLRLRAIAIVATAAKRGPPMSAPSPLTGQFSRQPSERPMEKTFRAIVTARCICGQVAVEASGTPITSAVCYCDDCQEGSRQIRSLPHAAAIDDTDGGTSYLVYRKDRVRCLQGAALLKPHKIRANSATNRVIATCCNSAMLVSFDGAQHWVDLYRSRCEGDVLPVQMRVCTRFKPEGRASTADVPEYAGYPPSLLVKLLVAKVAMLLHR